MQVSWLRLNKPAEKRPMKSCEEFNSSLMRVAMHNMDQSHHGLVSAGGVNYQAKGGKTRFILDGDGVASPEKNRT